MEAELRAYRELYQAEEHPAVLRALRHSALVLLDLLAPFNPYLTGSVLDGTAGEHSQIDILLFADSAKEVEIFLLNRGLEVCHGQVRGERVEAVLQVDTDTVDANLIVLSPQQERVIMKHRDGRVRERIKAAELRRMLEV